jgi:hypothetical protein
VIRSRLLLLSTLVACALGASVDAFAFISAGSLLNLPGRIYRNNVAYDSVNQVYLAIVGRSPESPLTGRFLNKNGVPIGADFRITFEAGDPYLGWASIAFGGPSGDPTFLVTYVVASGTNPKFARYVRYVPGGAATVSAPVWVTDVTSEWIYQEKAQNFWNGSIWIVGSRVMPPGASLPGPQVNAMDMAGNVSPPMVFGNGLDHQGSPAVTCAANGVCIAVGYTAGIPTGYSGGTYSRRFSGATLAPLEGFVQLASGWPNEDHGVVYQTHTGRFLTQWLRGGTSGGYIDTRTIGTDGSTSPLDLSRGIGPNAGTNAIAFNTNTRTSLLVTKIAGEHLTVLELGDNGYPINITNRLVITNWDGINDYLPTVSANNADRQWLVTANLTGNMVGRIIQGAEDVAGPFNKIAPASVTLSQAGITATWQPSTGALSYEVCYDTLNNNVCDTGWRAVGSATSAFLTEVKSGALYYWQVRARGGSNVIEANGGAWWSFVVEAIGKVAPIPGTVELPTSVQLSWQSSSGSVSYEICVDLTDNNWCDVAWVSVGTTTNATIPVSRGFTYFWQVRTVSSGGSAQLDDGAWWSFATVRAFDKAAPARDSAGHPTSVLLSWRVSVGATSYEYCYDTTNNNACDGGWLSAGGNTSVTASGLAAGFTYFWQVRARGSGSGWPINADSGQWWHFTVQSAPLSEAPAPTTPVDAPPGPAAPGAEPLPSPAPRPASPPSSPRFEIGPRPAKPVTLPSASLVAARTRGQRMLRSPQPIDLVGATGASLTFQSTFAGTGSPGRVEASLDGVTWWTVARVRGTVDETPVQIDLSSYAGRSVHLRFIRDDASRTIWRVDNIRVSANRER